LQATLTEKLRSSDLLGKGQSIFIGNHLKFLESLRDPLIGFEKFFCTVHCAGILLVLDSPRSEVPDAVIEAELTELVVRVEEISKLHKG